MKMISLLIPTYNEEENVVPLCEAIIALFKDDLLAYDYEIIFIDNDSSDSTRQFLARLCEKNKKVKAIFNSRNFRQFNSPYYGLCQTSGDCAILLCADFQDPLDMIPKYVKEWEDGYKIVCGIKTTSKENSLMYFVRTCYYKIIKRMSDVDQIEHFTGFGLYDKSVIQALRKLDDPTPFLRGIVAELGFKRKEMPYEQQKRRAGKSSYNWYRLYDAAMLSFTSYTKVGLRLSTMLGFLLSGLSLIVAMLYLVLKLSYWYDYPAGMAPIIIGFFFMTSVQLFFIGFLGEYILSIIARIMRRPLVIEEKRLNFENSFEGEVSSENRHLLKPDRS